MDRLVILDPPDVTIRFETGKKTVGTVILRNVMHTMPVAVQVKSVIPKKYVMKPPHAIIAPLGEVSVDIIMNAQNVLPDAFPKCPDEFTVKSVVVPGDYSDKSTVNVDWFTAKKKAVFCDTRLKVVYVGGGIIRNLIIKGNMDAVREVLERDPTVADATDEHGQTAMHVAVSMRRPEMVQVLLEYRANVEIRNKAGQTPLHLAACQGESLITELLLANSANTETGTDSGWRPLHTATVKGHSNIIELLVEHLANLDAAINDGRTAIHMAVAEGHTHCLKILLESGCNPNSGDLNGETALHTAAGRGHVAFVKLLLDKGANKDVRNSQGHTPYDEAANSGQTLLFDMLLLGDKLRQAARKGDFRGVKKLIRHGAIVDGEDQYGWTALHQATLKGRFEIVKYLIHKGADMDHTDEEGYTVLHTAVESGHKDIVQFLVDKRANLHARTKRGLTPLEVAEAYEYSGVARILQEALNSPKSVLESFDESDSSQLSEIIAECRSSREMETLLKKQPYDIEKYLRPVSFDSPINIPTGTSPANKFVFSKGKSVHDAFNRLEIQHELARTSSIDR